MKPSQSYRPVIWPLLLLGGIFAAAVGFWTQKEQKSMVDINAIDNGYPIIFRRVKERNARAIDELLEHGADIEAKGFFQATPIVIAGMANSWEVVELLLDRGANPRAVDGRGFHIPWLAANSQIVEGTKQHAALQRILPRLQALGVMEFVPHPHEARALLEAGKWPPEQWR